MAAIDACNSRFGRGAVVPARAGLVEKRCDLRCARRGSRRG
ncbi:DUF4113 domain-containing protein [uncultured Methylobacterium sp.]